ncbi:MAG TPA: class I SAM-dependent methyltransferase, partial [Dehalococcoidia bacterium]|nr:class I SAM-dependent methyltransferase [Dehalococcoidia bacterium]
LAAKRRAGSGDVRGIDASPEMIAVARRKAAKQSAHVDFQVALIEQLPFPDGTFDVILSSLMLHHLPDELKRKGFAEVKRVLKPGGRLFAVDMSSKGRSVMGRILRFIPGHRLPGDYLDRLKAMAQEAGFSDVESGLLGAGGLGYVHAVAK